MVIDLNSLSIQELRALLEQVDEQLSKRSQEALGTLRQRIAELVAAEGYSLQQVLPPMLNRKAKSEKPVKYRHPQTPSLTWTGRGKRPLWIKAWLAANGTLDQLAI